jgi:3-phosphoshikimate 1-carboxyvinyltransferase
MKSIKPFHFHHVIQANASKSDAQRCLILTAFSEYPVQIRGLDSSEDILSMLQCIKAMGAQFDKEAETIYPIREREIPALMLNVGESGFALRTLALVGLALTNNLSLSGSGTLLNRSQHQLCTTLSNLGLQVSSNYEKIPLQIQGAVTINHLVVNGTDGSQVISGLFLLAPLLEHESVIRIENPTSKPYLDMTISRMRDFGLSIIELEQNKYRIPGNQQTKLKEVKLEGDWSGAANHLVGAAISGQVEIHGLQKDSKQADRAILDILEEFGAEITWKDDILLVKEAIVKNPFHANIVDCPDLFPISVVLACSAQGISEISGIHRLKNKESNRLNVMCELLDKWNVRYQIEENNILIVGTGSVDGAEINTYDDHRIAMAGTIAACISAKEMILNEDACIKKSYPNFYVDLGV